MTTKEETKGKKDDALTKQPAGSAALAKEDFSDLDFDAPSDSMIVGESYLFKPGDEKLPGIFSSELDKKGVPVNGVQAGKPHCGWLPVQGWLVQEHHRPAKQGSGMRDYYQYEIMLTKPTVALDGDKHRRCKAGDLVLVKGGGNLHSLRGAAHDPNVITEVYLRPTGEYIPMKDGNKNPMRKWEKRALQQAERKLIKVPKLPAYVEDDDFEPDNLTN